MKNMMKTLKHVPKAHQNAVLMQMFNANGQLGGATGLSTASLANHQSLIQMCTPNARSPITDGMQSSPDLAH